MCVCPGLHSLRGGQEGGAEDRERWFADSVAGRQSREPLQHVGRGREVVYPLESLRGPLPRNADCVSTRSSSRFIAARNRLCAYISRSARLSSSSTRPLARAGALADPGSQTRPREKPRADRALRHARVRLQTPGRCDRAAVASLPGPRNHDHASRRNPEPRPADGVGGRRARHVARALAVEGRHWVHIVDTYIRSARFMRVAFSLLRGLTAGLSRTDPPDSGSHH